MSLQTNDDVNGIELQTYSREGNERQRNFTSIIFNDTVDAHCHGKQDSGLDKKARRKLIFATLLCLVFMVIEIVGGILANSLAIATDAAHLLTDVTSFLVSLISIWLASRPSSKRMSFGWHRAEVIGATMSVLMIWIVTGILVIIAVLRIINDDFTVDASTMLITSGIGVGINIVMGCTLHQHGHTHGIHNQKSHSHEFSVQPNPENGELGTDNHQEPSKNQKKIKTENINVKAAFIHVIGDFIQSLGVFTAAMMIYFKPEWKMADPICTLLFSVLVLATTISIMRNTLNVLMEGTPRDVNLPVAKNIFLEVPGIVMVHHLRIWSLTTGKTALSAHLMIDHSVNAQDVLKEASTKIREKYEIYELTLQVEEYEEEMDDCDQRQ